MADLILTDKEKADATFLEWTDEALGKLVKKTAQMIRDHKGNESTYIVAAATLLVCQIHDSNSTESTLTLEGVTDPAPIGDWEINIRKI